MATIEQATLEALQDLKIGASAAAQQLHQLDSASKSFTKTLGGNVIEGERLERQTKKLVDSTDSVERSFKSTSMFTNTLGKSFQVITKDTQQFANALVQTREGSDLLVSSTRTAVDKIGDLFKGVSNKIGEYMGNAVTFTVPLKMVGTTAGIVATALGSLAIAAATFSNDLFKSWNSLTSIGASFSGSILKVGESFNHMLTDLPTLGRVIQSSTEGFAMAFGSVQSGVDKFVSTIGELNRGNQIMIGTTFTLKEQMNSLGVSVTEQMEIYGEMMSNQIIGHQLRNKNEQELATITAAYITDLDKLAKLTGKSRKQLAQEQRQRAEDAEFQALMAGFSSEKQKAINDAISQATALYGQKGEDIVRAGIAGRSVTASDEANMFMAYEGGQELLKIGEQFARASDTGESIKQIWADNAGKLLEASKRDEQALQEIASHGSLMSQTGSKLLGIYGDSRKATIFLGGLLEQVGSLTYENIANHIAKQRGQTDSDGDGKLDSVDTFTEKMTNVNTAMNTVMADLQNWAFLHEEGLGIMEKYMSTMNGFVGGALDVVRIFKPDYILPSLQGYGPESIKMEEKTTPSEAKENLMNRHDGQMNNPNVMAQEIIGNDLTVIADDMKKRGTMPPVPEYSGFENHPVFKELSQSQMTKADAAYLKNLYDENPEEAKKQADSRWQRIQALKQIQEQSHTSMINLTTSTDNLVSATGTLKQIQEQSHTSMINLTTSTDNLVSATSTLNNVTLPNVTETIKMMNPDSDPDKNSSWETLANRIKDNTDIHTQRLDFDKSHRPEMVSFMNNRNNLTNTTLNTGDNLQQEVG